MYYVFVSCSKDDLRSGTAAHCAVLGAVHFHVKRVTNVAPQRMMDVITQPRVPLSRGTLRSDPTAPNLSLHLNPLTASKAASSPGGELLRLIRASLYSHLSPSSRRRHRTNRLSPLVDRYFLRSQPKHFQVVTLRQLSGAGANEGTSHVYILDIETSYSARSY